MKINLFPAGVERSVSINLDRLINNDGHQPIDVLLEDEKMKLIHKPRLKAKFSSYPVQKYGEFFDVECEILPWSNAFFISDYLVLMGRELRKVYDNLGPGMDSLHLFRDLWVEEFYFDTETKTIGMELGS